MDKITEIITRMTLDHREARQLQEEMDDFKKKNPSRFAVDRTNKHFVLLWNAIDVACTRNRLYAKPQRRR